LSALYKKLETVTMNNCPELFDDGSQL